MSLQFQTTHRFLIRVMRRSGLRMPWVRPQSTLSTIAYATNDVLLVLVGIYQFVFSAGSAVTIGNFQDICRLGTIFPVLGTGLVIAAFYIAYEKRLQKFIDNWNTLNLKILNSELDEADYFKQIYLEVSRSNESFAKRIVFLAFWTPILYCIPVPIIDAINHAYRTNHPLPILYPYDDRQPGVYEITFCLHVVGLVTSVTKQIENDCFFLSLFKIQSVYLKWLSASLKRLGEQFEKNGDRFIERKQIVWIKFHTELIRNTNELVAIYTPFIVIYYFHLIIVVVCGLFTQIKNDRDNLIQRIGVGGFGLINIFQLYMISSTAEELATESDVVALEIYKVPWYKMNKSNADMLRLMLLVAKHPVRVTAFRSPTFLRNKETFLGFVASAITALMTFSKMNDIMKRNSQS